MVKIGYPFWVLLKIIGPERASLEHIRDLRERVGRLRALGFRIALDDLGAGYAGLTSFTLLEPAMAKLDMSLIRGIDAHSGKQAIVRSMCRLCEELKSEVIGEMRNGHNATFIIFQTPEEGIGIPLALDGFGQGYDALP